MGREIEKERKQLGGETTERPRGGERWDQEIMRSG